MPKHYPNRVVSHLQCVNVFLLIYHLIDWLINCLLTLVETFMCLSSIIDKNGCTDAVVKAKIGTAKGIFIQLKNIWSSKVLSLHTKIRLFNSNVKYVLLYGAETWRTSNTTSKKLQTIMNTYLRRILQIRPNSIMLEMSSEGDFIRLFLNKHLFK